MPPRSRLRLLIMAPLVALLSGCPLPIPPFFPLDPIGAGFGEKAVVVENATDREWVITFDFAFYPQSFAVPANRTGRAILYEGNPTGVSVADRECAVVATLDGIDASAALRIDADGRIVSADPPPDASSLPSLVEYFECDAFGRAPDGGEPVPDAAGTVFLIGEDGTAWLLEPSSGSLEPLPDASPDGFDVEFAWSPDGSRLAFARFDETDGSQAVYVLDAEGTEPLLLVDDAISPAWSPDGTRIAYLSSDPFAGGSTLMVVDAGGGEPRTVTEDAGAPAWSPDGTWIAYVTSGDTFSDPFGGGSEELRVVEADGGEPITLSEAQPFGSPPRWSPDGRSIAYAGGDFMRGDVRVIASDGGEPRVLPAPAGTMLGEPAWSSDGRRLLVTTTATGLFRTGGGVGVFDLSTDRIEMLVDHGRNFYSTPVWSPDEAFVAAVVVDESFTSKVVVIRVSDGSVVEVASGVMAIAGWRP